MPSQKVTSCFGGDTGTGGTFLEDHGNGLSSEGFGSFKGVDGGSFSVGGLVLFGKIEEATKFFIAVG